MILQPVYFKKFQSDQICSHQVFMEQQRLNFFPGQRKVFLSEGKVGSFFLVFVVLAAVFVHKAFIGSRKSDGVIEIVRTYYKKKKKKLKY